jgi:hypothetical protein
MIIQDNYMDILQMFTYYIDILKDVQSIMSWMPFLKVKT